MQKALDNYFVKFEFNKSLICYTVFFLLTAVTVSISYYTGRVVRVPTAVLILRELLFIIPLAWLVWTQVDRKYILYVFILCGMITLHAVTFSGVSRLLYFGLRSLIPVFLLFAISKPNRFKIDYDFVLKLVKTLFLLNFAAQIANLFFGYGAYGKLVFGLNARNPGLFLYPAVSAFFILILFYIYIKSKVKISALELVVFLTSVTLCSSITGMLGVSVLLALQFRKLTVKTFFLSLILVIFGFYFLHSARMAMFNENYDLFDSTETPSIVNDDKSSPTYLRETGGGRVKIFLRTLKNTDYSPANFGEYTNAGFNYNGGVNTDSLFPSLIGNLGFFWSTVVAAFLGYFLYINYRRNENIEVIFLVLICAAGLNVQETGLTIFLAILSRFLPFPSTAKV